MVTDAKAPEFSCLAIMLAIERHQIWEYILCLTLLPAVVVAIIY